MMSILTCYTQQNPTQGHPSFFLSFLQKLEHVIGRQCFIHMRIPVNNIVQADRADA